MADTKTLERIYNLKVLGGDNAVKAVDSISKSITSLDAKVKQLKSVGSTVAESINKGVADSVKNTGATTTAIGLQKTMTKEIANQRIERERSNKEMKLQAQLDLSERNSLGRAQLLILKYTAEKKKLNLATEEGRRLNESYNKAIEKSNTFILKNADAETLRTKNVGNYKVIVQGLTPEIEKAVTAFERANLRATQLEQTLGKTHPAAKAARNEFEGLRRPLEDMGVQIEKVSFQSNRAAQAQFSLQQVLRETPSIANGLPVFFSAISNNLPILTDNFRKLREETGSNSSALKTLIKGVFSFQTALLAGLTILTVYGKDIVNWTSNLLSGSKALSEVKRVQESTLEIQKKAADNYAEEVTKLELIRKKLTDLSIKQSDRVKLLKQYNETADKQNRIDVSQINNIALINERMSRQIQLIKQRALATAAEQVIAEKAKKVFELQLEIGAKSPQLDPNKTSSDVPIEQQSLISRARKLIQDRAKQLKIAGTLSTEEILGFANVSDEQIEKLAKNNDAFKILLDKGTKEQLLAIDKRRTQIQKDENVAFRQGGKLDNLFGDLNKAQQDFDDASKAGEQFISILDLIDKESKPTTSADTESNIEKLKKIYDSEKKQLETQFNDNKISEKKLNEDLIILTNKFRSDKLLITKQANKKDEQDRISLNESISKDAKDANEKLFELEKQAVEQRFSVAIAGAERINNAIQDNPRATEVEKIKAEIELLTFRKNEQESFNKEMQALEKKYGQLSVSTEQERADAIDEIDGELRRKRYEQAVATYNEQIRLQQEAVQKFRNEAETRAAQKTIDVLNSELTARQKANAIRKIQQAETKEILAGEVEAAKIALEQKEKALKDGLATEIEVSEAKKRLKKAELEYAQFTSNQELTYLQKLKQGFKDVLANLTNFFKGIKAEQKDVSDAIAAASATINDAISQAKQAFFDNKNQEVDDAKQAALERLDIEQSQLESFAQSEAEKDSIRRQFEVKRKEAEKQAGEEKKKIALQQLTLDFAVAVVKTLAAYPFPFSLIPVAALGISYAIQRSIVKNTKFARGGMPNNGGDIVGPSHAEGGVPFNYEAEGGELSIINKKSASSKDKLAVTGTPRQIASAINEWGGGVRFAGGAGVRKLEYGGNLGSNLRPPVNPSSFLNPNSGSSGNSDSSVLNAIIAQSIAISDISNQVTKMKVFVVAKEVDAQNSKDKKAAEIGTL